MANEFIIRKGFKSLQDSELTGSLNLSGNIVADGTVQAEFASNTSTAISGAFNSVSSSLASELLKNTTDTLTGDLTVTGTLTAQEFHTEFTSASIVYESGSTQFGDSSDDTHIFSGSALVSGSIGIGTSSPDNGLHVKDTNIHLQASNAKIKLSDFDNSMYLRMNNTGSLEVTDSNEVSLVHFNKNGKVGIGTNSPAELLHLYSVSNSGPEIRFQHPSGSHYIRAYDNNWNFLVDTSVQAISIQNNGTTTFGANVLLGNTVVNPATGFADQSGIGLKESSTIPKIEVSSDDTALSLNRTTTGGAGVIADLRYESNVRHSFGTATSYMLGSVGIGTTSPSSTLHLKDNFSSGIAIILDRTELASVDNLFYAGVSTGGSTATDFMFLGTGTTHLALSGTGNVGIGEPTPLGKLHIKGSDTGVSSPSTQGNLLVLEDSENGLSILSSTAGAGYINFGDSDDNDVGMIIYGHSSNSMDFWTNAGKRMTIASSGDVGIGTATPADTIGYGRALDIQSSTGAAVYLRDSDNPTTQYGFLAYDGNDNGLKLNNENSSGFIRFNTAGTERMRIYSGGTVEITNSTSPKLRLTRGGKQYTSRVDNNNKFVIQEEGGNEFFVVESGASASSIRIDNTGNVGIGTTDPQTHLDVVSSAHTKFRVRTTGVADASMEVLGYDAGVHIGDATNGNRWAIWNDGVSTTSPLSFGSYALGTWYVPGSQVLTLAHNGNVGIGETTPDNTLHIKTSNSGGPQIELESTQATANSAFINFDSTNLQLSTARDMVSGAWHDTSKSWGGITIEGGSAGSRVYFATAEAANTSPTTRMSINKDGNVLIGGGSEYTGTGVTSLTINNDSYPTLSLGSTSASRMAIIAYNSYNYLSSSNPFFFDTGKVGIGTTSASSVLQVHGNQKWYTTNADGNELRGWFVVGGSADPSNLRLYDANATDYWISLHGDGRIYSKGLVTNYGTGTGTYTQTTYYHDTSNGLLYEGGRTTNSNTGTGITWKFTWRGGAGTGGGVQLVHGDSAWSALSSDERLKTKTADIENGLDAINALSPIKYKWNTDIGSESEREITGFTAQNVQSAIPDAVFASSQDEELGDILTYRQNYITAYLVKAVQELSAKNDQLQAEIDALKNA